MGLFKKRGICVEKRQVFAIILLISALASGVAYGKWNKSIEAGVGIEEMKFTHSGLETYALVFKSERGIYSVDVTDMEISRDGTSLNIIVDGDKIASKMEGEVDEIILSYSIQSIDKDNILNLDISDTGKEKDIVISSSGQLSDINADIIKGKKMMDTETNTDILNRSNNKAIVSHQIQLNNPIMFSNGSVYEFDVEANIMGQSMEKKGKKDIWSQKLKLQCKLIVQKCN